MAVSCLMSVLLKRKKTLLELADMLLTGHGALISLGTLEFRSVVIICIIINRVGSNLPSSSVRISSRLVFSWLWDRGILILSDILQRCLSQFLGQRVYLLRPDLLMLDALTLLIPRALHAIWCKVVGAVVKKV